MIEYYIMAIIIACCLGILPANIAKRKGKDFTIWWIYGSLLWIVAIFHAISLPEIMNSSSAKDNDSENLNTDFMIIHEEICEAIDLNSPVEIKNYQLLKNSENNIFLRIQFKNLSEGEISALKLSISGENSLGDQIYINGNKTIEVTIQDLNISLNSDFKNETEIKLPSNDIRKVKLDITQVMFANHDNIKIHNHYVTPYKTKITNQDALQCAKTMSSDAEYYFSENSEYWICKCGRANRPDNIKCVNCRSEKSIVKKKFTEDYIINNSLPEFLIQQKIEIEKKEALNKIEEELTKKNLQEKRRKQKSTFKFAGAIAGVVCFALLINFGLSTYKIQNLIKNNKYEEALNEVGNLNSFSILNKKELINELQQQFYSNLSNNDILKVDEIIICADKNTIYTLDENKNKTVYFELPNEKNDKYRNKANDNLFSSIKGNVMYTKGFILFISDITGIDTLYVIDMTDPTKNTFSIIDGAMFGVGLFDTLHIDSLTKLYDGNILLGYYKSAIASEDRWVLFTPSDFVKSEQITYLSSEQLKKIYSINPPKKINSDSFEELINSIDYIYSTKKDL